MEAIVEILKKTQPDLSEAYISQGYTRAIIFGVIMAALVIFTAMVTKNAKGIGITAGILQIAGTLGAHIWIVNFSSMEMMKKIVGTPDKIDQMVSDYYSENIPKILGYLLGMALVILSIVMLLVFILKLMKIRPKVFAVLALIISILRLVVFAPVNTFNVLEKATEASQISWDGVTMTVAMINVALVAVVGVIALIKNKTAPKTEDTPAE